MKKKTKALLLQLPALIVLIGATLMALIIKLFNIAPFNDSLSWPTAILLLLVMILYFLGRKIERPSSKYSL
jgi:hypothetical protein